MLIDPAAITQAKETLGLRNAELMQELFQMDQWDERRMVGCCPNPAHDDSRPSCSYNPKTHSLHCFACGFTVDAIGAHMMVKGSTFAEACQWLFNEAGIQYDFTEIGVKTRGQSYRYPKPVYAPNKDKVYAYWSRRKISPATIDYAGVQQDEKGNTLFQYWDLNDVLTMVKVRPSRAVKKGETKIWCLPGADTTNLLFNINKAFFGHPLYVTCGEGDALSLIECGFYNTVSIPLGDQNTAWVAEQFTWLEKFNEIILVHDNDESGRKFVKNVSTRLGEYRVKVVDLPKTLEVDGEKIAIKDVNELLFYGGKEAVCEAMNSARDSEIPSVVDYTDVERFNMSDKEGFYTGLKSVDSVLGKCYMGSTTIITGSPGSGKSSFLSTIMAQSVEQEFPVFCYSGELSNPSLKSWVDFVMCGQTGVDRYLDVIGSPYYKVNPEASDAINRFYKNKIFFYKDGFSQDGNDVLAAAESCVRKYGVRTVVIDNMTSLGLGAKGADEKWSLQEELVRKIIAFSVQFDVCVFLVIHPKKLDTMRHMTLFDLSGISASANLAHRILSLYRVPEKEKQDQQTRGGKIIPGNRFSVEIDVLKDRFGSAGGQSTDVFYDVPSRRFFDSRASLGYRYAWDERMGIDLPFGCPQLDAIDAQAAEVEREVYGTIRR